MFKKVFFICLFLISALTSPAFPQNIHYVDTNASGNNNGTSWEHAFNYLQDALVSANTGDQIWVTEGTYKPDQGGGMTKGDPNASFQLKSGVNLYGGFRGDETSVEKRHGGETILSGDLNGNDFAWIVDWHLLCMQPWEQEYRFYGPRTDNSINVIKSISIDSETILDDFIIEAGINNDSNGGGMYNESTSLIIRNCTFRYNFAQEGGGIYNKECNLTLKDCDFSFNWSFYSGGGLMNVDSSIEMNSCSFKENRSLALDGCGMASDGCNLNVEDCTFTSNCRPVYDCAGGFPCVGGGMYNSYCNLTVTNCYFLGNGAWLGGGMFNFGDSLELRNCTFEGNLAEGDMAAGGGIGGGLVTGGGTIINCVFSGNEARIRGGGMSQSGNSTIINSTFTYNTAGMGGGMIIWGTSTVINSIIWGNSAKASVYGDQIRIGNRGTLSIKYSDIQGGRAGIVSENINGISLYSDNLEADPLFRHGYNIQENSPCIDTGTNEGAPNEDILGVKRPQDGDNDGNAICDMGAYEYLPPCEGDFDCDKDVDGTDLSIFAADFGRTNCADAPPCEGDFDKDGDVDGSDFAIFAADFGRTDCPLCP